MKKQIVASLLIAGAMAVQQTNKVQNLAQVDQDCGCDCFEFEHALPEPCTCFCPTTPGAPPPSGSAGSASNSVFNTAISAQTGQVTQQIPNTGSVTNCDGDCHACNALNEQTVKKGSRSRDFHICGDIHITEDICEEECGAEREISEGKNHKDVTCSTINQNGGSGTAPGSGQVCVSLGGGSGVGCPRDVIEDFHTPTKILSPGAATCQLDFA